MNMEFALLMPLIGFVAILCFILTMRYMRHLERMEMIRRGISSEGVPAALASPQAEVRLRLYAGVILTAAGLALLLTLGLFEGFGTHLVGGLIPFFVGVGLLIVHGLAAKG